MIEIKHRLMGRINVLNLKLDTVHKQTFDVVYEVEKALDIALKKYPDLESDFESVYYKIGILDGIMQELK